MKKVTKVLIIVSLLFSIISMYTNVFAAELKTKLDVIQEASETKELENDQGYISKTIVNSNESTGEVTIELKLSNTKKNIEKQMDTEIFLVVDNSPSMDFVTSSGKTRKELVLNSTSSLVEAIFNNSSNVKMGLIDFHGRTGGWFGEPASIINATVRQNLTDSKETMITAIQKQLQRETEGGTNIDAGLQRAQQNFTKANNRKIIILLTDGIPNADVKGTEVEDANDVTDVGNIEIGKNTKNTLLNLKNSGIYVITLLTGMSDSDGNTDKNGTEYEDNNTLEEKLKAAEDIFGTPLAPTANKYYLVNNVDINKIISEDIFADVMEKIQSPLNKVKIVDYFPEEILENFDFSYVGNPSVGKVTEGIDPENKTIEWDIDTLKGDEVATLQYKLKIKDMKNEELLNKVISTNEKVVLTYQDIDAKEYTVNLTNSPKISLAEIKDENDNENTNNNTNDNNNENNDNNDNNGITDNSENDKTNNNGTDKTPTKDNTIADGKIPQTGESMLIGISIVAVIVGTVCIYIKSRKYRDI